MMKTIRFVLLIICVFHAYTVVRAQDTILIIRHGEKPKEGDNLSCKGLNRALAIPGALARYGVPLYTYVPAVSCESNTTNARMFQTVTPMAAKYNLTVNSKHEVSDVKGLAKALEGKLGTKGKHGYILVVWEHGHIPKIARELGLNNPPKWDGDDFDSIWIITNAGTKNASLHTASEGLNGVGSSCK